MVWRIILVLLQANYVVASPTSMSNCTNLDNEVNFINGCNTRSTLDILWTCLFTLVACTWTILHLNIPEQRGDRDRGWRGDLKWTSKRTWTKLKWMIIAILAPEILVLLAMTNLAHAKKVQVDFKDYVEEDDVPWSLTHSMFVDMGGFTIQAVPSQSWTRPITTFQLSEKVQNSRCYHLTALKLLMLRKYGIIARLPYITKDEINGRSKSDAFSKTIAIIQIASLVFQVVFRMARGLAVSQLEIAVMAFSVCGILIYALSWNKPKDCQTPTAVLEYTDSIPAELLARLNSFHEVENESITLSSCILLTNWLDTRHKQGSNICNDIVSRHLPPGGQPYHSTRLDIVVGVTLGSSVFGAIHLLAWNIHFPNEKERTVWRASSIICTCLPIIFSFIGPVFRFALLQKFGRWLTWPLRSKGLDGKQIFDFIFKAFFSASCLVYLAARLYMMIEMFRTLFFLPKGAYISTWQWT